MDKGEAGPRPPSSVGLPGECPPGESHGRETGLHQKKNGLLGDYEIIMSGIHAARTAVRGIKMQGNGRDRSDFRQASLFIQAIRPNVEMTPQ